jgi:hypothetical protein
VVSEAIASLISYWAGLPSSLTEDVNRNWNYAVWRAQRHASTLMYRLVSEEQPLYLDVEFEGNEADDSRSGNIDRPHTMYEWLEYKGLIVTPSPELSDDEYTAKVERFVSAIPTEEMEQWLDGVQRGESTRECARRTGVSHMTIARRRAAGRKRLTALASTHGLEVA